MNYVQCEICSAHVPASNIRLHSLRCSRQIHESNPNISSIHNITSSDHVDDVISSEDEWACSVCTCLNSNSLYACQACDNLRDGIIEHDDERHIEPDTTNLNLNNYREDVWQCDYCASSNRRDVLNCRVCSNMRPTNTGAQQSAVDFNSSSHVLPGNMAQCTYCSSAIPQNSPVCIDCGAPTSTHYGYQPDPFGGYWDGRRDSVHTGVMSAAMLTGAVGGAGLSLIMSSTGDNTNRRGNRMWVHEGRGISVLDGAIMGAGLGMLVGNFMTSDMEVTYEGNNEEEDINSSRRHAIEALPTHRFSGERVSNDDVSADCDEVDHRRQCIVCRENYATNEEIKTLSCFHMFHTNCIDRWLLRTPSCPICKTAVVD